MRREHFVSQEPFNPHSIEALTPVQEKYYMASQWQLMWWKLKRHRLAVICGVILALNYMTILFSEVIAPYDLHTRHTEYIYSPPQSVHLFHEGRVHRPVCLRPWLRTGYGNTEAQLPGKQG